MLLKGIHLTLLMGPVVPAPAPQVVVDALQSVEVTSSAGEASGFQLTFGVNKKSPVQTMLLLSGGRVPPLLRVIVMVTLNGAPQVLMDGVVTNHALTPGGEGGQDTLTLRGRDLTAVMDLQELSGLPYPAMTAEARVAFILLKYAAFGLMPMIIPVLFTDLPNPVERYPTQRGTDLQYIRQLALEVGYIFYIEPGPAPGMNIAYWGPEIKVGVPQPALNINMDAHTNVEALNFSFEAADNKLPIVFIQNSLTKFPLPIPIPNINPLQPPLGLIPAPVQGLQIMDHTAKLSPAQALAEGVAAAARAQEAVKGSGHLDVLRYGRPLKARQLVGVRGAGLAFDGLYFVKQVTSTLKRGEFKQNFELTRNGLISITPRVPV